MNRLNTWQTGGMPLSLEDFRFLDNANRQALADIATSVYSGRPTVIMYGCRASSHEGGYLIEAGAIYHENEIWHVDQHFFVAPNPMPEEPFWIFDSSPGPEGSKTFYDGSVHNVHEVRKAYLSLSPSANSLPASSVVRYEDINKAQAKLFPNTSAGVRGAEDGTPSLITKIGNIVSINASFICDQFNGNTLLITTIPEAYRYSGKLLYPVIGYSPSLGYVIYFCTITRFGELFINYPATHLTTAVVLTLNILYAL